MGYMFDLMDDQQDKLKASNKLITIIRKLDPKLLAQARRIAAGKEQLPVTIKQRNS